MEIVTIEKCVYDEIIEHAKEAFPKEGCGLLIGKGQNITSFLPLVNESISPNEFNISKSQLEIVLKEITFTNLEVLAIYHSHPRQRAIPSSLDLLNHPNQDIYMMILSLKHKLPVLNCYRIDQLHYQECLIEVK